MARKFHSPETKAIHSGEPHPPINGAVNIPIFQSSTFESSVSRAEYNAQRYMRLSNTPTHIAVHEKLAALENAPAALVSGSGMAAIATGLLSVLSAGDHLLVQKGAYGGTHALLTHDFPALNISFDFVDGNDPAAWTAALKPNTKAFLVESMSNPLLEVADLEGVVAFSKKHNLTSLIDNTFSSPINFRPIEWGFDLSLHSASKYLNGHSDVIAGAIIGSAELVDRARIKQNHLGGSLDTHATYLLYRGMKTLALRVERQNYNAQKLAEYLERHPAVKKVNYPGLASHPQHKLATHFFDGFGGTLSFEIKGNADDAARVVSAVQLPISAPSLGGVEALITRPATTSHSSMSPEARLSMGITDTLIRYAVGIELIDDLIADLDQALSA